MMREGWEYKMLGEVCETSSGGTPLKAYKEFYENGTIPWLLSGEVSQGEIFKAQNFITETGLKNSSAKLFPKNSVLVAMYGATAGQVGILRIEACTNQAVCAILPNKRLLPEFIFYCFQSKKDELIAQAIGNAQPNISQEKIRNTVIPLPPLPEQHRIVALLDEAFAAIERVRANTERNLRNVREVFENALSNIFINSQEEWKSEHLEKLASFRNGLNYTKSSKGELIKIVGVKDFQKNFWVPVDNLETIIIDGALSEMDELKDGDILAVRSNGNPELIGRTLLAKNIESKTSHSGFTIRIRLNTNILDPEFLCNYLKTENIRKALVRSGNGVNIKSLNQGSLAALKINFPQGIKDQQTIVHRLDALSTETRRLEALYRRKLTALDELKRSLLQRAFAGELTEKGVTV